MLIWGDDMATTVLGLKTFTASDPVDYNEINDNYVKIDNGVKTAMQGRAAHNLLDNSDFRNPVNQRGATSYTGTGVKVYTIDRWHTWSESISVSVQSGYLSVTNSTDSIYQNISQIIDKHNLTGKAATIAVWDANGNVYCASGLMSTNNEIVCNTPTDFWFSAILKDDNTIYFAIRPRGAKTATIKAAALYEGSYDASTLPAYQPKGYAAELAECMRYQRIRGTDNYAIATLGAEKVFAIEHPGMRIAPTVQVINPLTNAVGNIASYTTGGEFQAVIVGITKDRTIVKVESGTPGNTYIYAYNINADL